MYEELDENLTSPVWGMVEGEEKVGGKAKRVESLEDAKVDGWGAGVTVYRKLDSSNGSQELEEMFSKLDCKAGTKDDLVELNQVADQGAGSN